MTAAVAPTALDFPSQPGYYNPRPNDGSRKARPKLYNINKDSGTLTLSLHPGQAKAWISSKRFIFVLAGTQGGKTSFGPHWLYREIRMQGPGDYLCVTSTFPLLKLKMLPEFLALFEHTLKLGTWHQGDRVFTFHQTADWSAEHVPTRVIFGSASNSDSLESATAKGAWVDEVGQDDFRLESWEAILRRLALNQGRVLGTTTPYNLGWLKQLVYDKWEQGLDDDIDVIQFASVVNPAFPEDEDARAKAQMASYKYQMFYRGKFERPPNLIYSDFDRLTHTVPRFDIPDTWHWGIGVDFGAVNTATLYIAWDPERPVDTRRYFIVESYLEANMTTIEHTAAMKLRLNMPMTPEEREARADPDYEGPKAHNVRNWQGGAKPEVQQRMDWQAGGIPLMGPFIHSVESGIDKVIALFKLNRLFVFDDLVELIRDFGMYTRTTDNLGNVEEDIKDKDKFHRLDSLRYIAPVLEIEPIREQEGVWDG